MSPGHPLTTMIGQTLGHYRIEEKLGAGGMGEVYRARDTRLERDVALKFLPESAPESGGPADPAARERLLREARAAAALNHPHICTVYEVGEHQGRPYLALELLEGQTLAERLAAGPLPPEQLLELALQLADALDVAHRRGVIHRDLKPGNIFLTGDRHAKILDFGLAKRAARLKDSTASLEAALTRTGATVGTIAYMSPEQVRAEEVDTRSDLFSLGAVLYEMATGQRAFDGPAVGVIFDAILNRDSVPPARLNPRLPPGLEEIIRKLLEKDRELRYQTAAELRADLKRLKRDLEATRVAAAPSSRPLVRTDDASIVRQGEEVVIDVRDGEEKVHVAMPFRQFRRHQWLGTLLVAAVLLALLGVLLVAFNVAGLRDRLRPTAARPAIRSLAVLPLDNLSRDPEQEFFADGMTDALIADLAQIGALRVISRTSVMPYKGARKPLPEIARELNVEAIVEGSVQRAGERVRVTAQLIHAPSDSHLWAKSYERDLRDVLALQSEIARAIAGEIRIQLTPREEQSLARSRRVRPEAYEAYLRGRFVFQAHEREDARNREAIEWFERAVALDPEFAQAQAALARAYLSRFFSHEPRPEWEQKAYVHLEKALALDPNLAEAYVARGDLSWTLANRFPHERAVEDYERALALNPNLADAHFGLGSVYHHIGLMEKSLEHLRTAAALDPLRPDARIRIPRVYLYQQDYAAALAEFDRSPDFPLLWQWQKALALFYLKRNPEAFALLERIRREHADQDDVTSTYALLLAGSGRRREAEEQIRRAIQIGEGKSHFHHAAYNIASAYALLGNTRAALDWLARTAEQGMPCYPLFARDPNLDRLRDNPEFVAWLGRIKTQWERYQATL